MTYRIADLNVQMEVGGRTARQAEPYLRVSEEPIDLTVRCEPALFQKRNPHLSLDDCEYLTSGTSFYRRLTGFGGLMLHASAIEVDGLAYLFCGTSGIGKSTHTGLWRSLYGADRVRIINDDKPALRLVEDVWYAYGTPWSGRDDLQRNVRVPLAGICFLGQGQRNEIHPLEGAEAVHRILNQTVRPSEAHLMLCLLESIDRLLARIPLWSLTCTPTEAAAELAYETMTLRGTEGNRPAGKGQA
jgi:hypothetical protein